MTTSNTINKKVEPFGGIDVVEEEARRLAPYALKSRDSLASENRGRRYPEPEHSFRTPFQRDRDRIIHCNAFRRLEYKTQVFVYHEGDHYRTRLTHTIEVAQISRTIARALGLNEDAAEAIALAHDLGHPPFGHTGEKTLDSLMADHGGFEHNAHSLRIVEDLEIRYPGFSGLNLTWEVREGIVKHSSQHDRPEISGDYEPDKSPCLEAQIVDIADEIAYNNHDIDDGLSSEMLDARGLEDVALWRESFAEVKKRFPGEDFKIHKYQTIIHIINRQATDMVEVINKTIAAGGIETLEQIRDKKERTARFSAEMEEKNQELKNFLSENLYHHYRVLRMADKAERIIEGLFGAYLKNPKMLPPDKQAAAGRTSEERAICDHLAGMTDRYALDDYKKFFDPYERV